MTAARATAATVRSRGWRRTAAYAEAVTARNDALHWLAVFWMNGEGVVLHALLNFETLWLLALRGRYGFVNVSCHGKEE